MFNLIIILILSLIILTLSYKNIHLKIKNRELILDLLQSNIDNTILVNKFEIENSSDYLNFLDTTRNDAFLYIETVQLELNDFKDSTEKIIKHFNEFGEVASSFPLYNQMKILVDASEKIYKLLPENNKG